MSVSLKGGFLLPATTILVFCRKLQNKLKIAKSNKLDLQTGTFYMGVSICMWVDISFAEHFSPSSN